MKERLLKPVKKTNPNCKRWMDGFVLNKSMKDDLDISQARARMEIQSRKRSCKRIKVTE